MIGFIISKNVDVTKISKIKERKTIHDAIIVSPRYVDPKKILSKINIKLKNDKNLDKIKVVKIVKAKKVLINKDIIKGKINNEVIVVVVSTKRVFENTLYDFVKSEFLNPKIEKTVKKHGIFNELIVKEMREFEKNVIDINV